MRVFSQSLESFLKKLTLWTKEILRDEFGVRVARTRFHTSDGWTWPIVLVAIDDAARLGYFDPDHYIIGVHKSLMYTAKDQVIKDLLRHELAHYFTFIECSTGAQSADWPAGINAHGPEFRAVCEKYHLAADVRAASVDVRGQNEAIEGELESEAVIEKIRKLMSLAQSDNEHEAALATVRANQLMLKHNLDAIAASGGPLDEIEYCVRLVIASRRSNPRIAAIGRILREFLVVPVHTGEGLEVTGTRANVENAEYIASFLDREGHDVTSDVIPVPGDRAAARATAPGRRSGRRVRSRPGKSEIATLARGLPGTGRGPTPCPQRSSFAAAPEACSDRCT